MIDIYQNYTKADIIKQLDMYYKQFIIENKDISIKCPVILIAGEYDNTGKVLLYSKQWAKDIKSHLYIIKNAAHLHIKKGMFKHPPIYFILYYLLNVQT